MTDVGIKEMRLEAERMFYHGFENYMKHAFPDDELKPISCAPLTRDRANPAHIELNDALGNYSLTLIDSLSTLAIMASSPSTTGSKNKALSYFQKGVGALVEQYGDGTSGETGKGKRATGFDVDSKVQVFETVIRGVGGLLSAHLFAVGDLPIKGYHPKEQSSSKNDGGDEVLSIQWPNGFVYEGQLLRLAQDLGRRILPAFYTTTGIPYPRVNLRYGVPFYVNSPLNQNAEIGQCQATQGSKVELTETCSAGAGSLVLEFATLSRLTGDLRYEQLAKRAFWSVWERKSSIGLVGAGIDAETGLWLSGYTGIGAGIDSFYEYAHKASVLLSGSSLSRDQPLNLTERTPTSVQTRVVSEEQQTAEAFGRVWQESHASIKRHLYRGDMYIHPHYVQADLYTGASRAFWLDSLSAFYPGLLATTGNLEEAIETHLLATALWTRYSALPERWSASTGSIESGLSWWGGRPEFIESTYHLYRVTRDPWYLHVGEMTLRDIKRRCWTKCGWAGLQDVRNGDLSDRMESFFLGETTKYLFLLFDEDHPLNKLDAPFVFSTEGHPLILSRRISERSLHSRSLQTGMNREDDSDDSQGQPTCPLPPAMVPFSLSATAARADIFHAANLARLHLMPTRDDIESPLAEYSRDHPSISISDVRSPSNYTYFPWTLPLELIPHNATCSKITARHTFDITFPTGPNMLMGPGFLQRVGNGILINSMGGVRLGMIQDVPFETDDGTIGKEYRVQAINNILLGKDERIFIAKDTASNVVNPLDPNFTRVRDTSMLDLIVDIQPLGESQTQGPTSGSVKENESSASGPSPIVDASVAANPDVASNMKQAFSSLLQHVASLIVDPTPAPPPPTIKQYPREYVAAVLPVGVGVAPLPDVDDALGPDIHGAPQGDVPWHSIYVTDENCNSILPASVPKEHQVIVIKRGGCSFDEKLRNIPTFAPSKKSLQLVVVVSYEDEPGLPSGWLIRPLLESQQTTASGLLRHNPIAMVMVGGGEGTYGIFEKAVGLGLKRRYSMQAQGVPISNLVIL
ncbi:alpha mannosidase-like protein [Imshaugia aleurites]|uniref:alpha-1,2-Mannosidase n=1 Tax=Imshaugia aleurites TaxID=172621 RepID=A0A8H3J5A1_9LECA|nr:alpha mannosidase-like protein [Imshaugia aleurites]